VSTLEVDRLHFNSQLLQTTSTPFWSNYEELMFFLKYLFLLITVFGKIFFWENLMGLMKNYTWFWWNVPPLVD
jgi:hypothetical protein